MGYNYTNGWGTDWATTINSGILTIDENIYDNDAITSHNTPHLEIRTNKLTAAFDDNVDRLESLVQLLYSMFGVNIFDENRAARDIDEIKSELLSKRAKFDITFDELI